MYASIRRYSIRSGGTEEFMRRVDEGFAKSIAVRPGFCSYEALDCGGDEALTISLFGEAEQAEESRGMAKAWADANLEDLDVNRLEALHGQVRVSRAIADSFLAGHAEAAADIVNIRRYSLTAGSVDELMHIVDERFADKIAESEGFARYQALDCGDEVISVSQFADQEAAERSSELAAAFVRDELGSFGIERTAAFDARVIVSRAVPRGLRPAHA